LIFLSLKGAAMPRGAFFVCSASFACAQLERYSIRSNCTRYARRMNIIHVFTDDHLTFCNFPQTPCTTAAVVLYFSQSLEEVSAMFSTFAFARFYGYCFTGYSLSVVRA